jgi:hypothetical protein
MAWYFWVGVGLVATVALLWWWGRPEPYDDPCDH